MSSLSFYINRYFCSIFGLAVAGLFNCTDAQADQLREEVHEGPLKTEKSEIDSLLNEATQNSMSLKSLDEQIRGLHLKMDAAQATLLPTLSLEGGPIFERDGQAAEQDESRRDTYVSAYARLDWNLYRGGADRSLQNTLSKQLETLQNQRKRFVASLRADIATFVTLLHHSAEAITLYEAALATGRRHHKSALAKTAAGITAKTDALEFELHTATLEAELLDLKTDQAEQQRRLSSIVGGAPRTFPTVGTLTAVRPNIDRKALLSDLKDLSDDLTELELDALLKDRDAAAAAAGYLPRVDLEGRYGLFGDRARSVRSPSGRDFDSVELLVKFSLPLVGGISTFARNTHQAALADAAAARLNYADRRTKVEAEVDMLIATLASLGSRLDLEEKNLIAGSAYLDATQREYRLGTKNSPDLIGATEKVLHSRLKRLQIIRDLVLTAIRLQKLSGKSVY